MPRQARTAERAMRRWARMLTGRNELRRSCDRVEGAVAALLLAAFLVAIAGAFVLGAHIYAHERAEAARLHPGLAVLTQSGPYNTGLNAAGEATARWHAPGGQARSGMLTKQQTLDAIAVSCCNAFHTAGFGRRVRGRKATSCSGQRA